MVQQCSSWTKQIFDRSALKWARKRFQFPSVHKTHQDYLWQYMSGGCRGWSVWKMIALESDVHVAGEAQRWERRGNWQSQGCTHVSVRGGWRSGSRWEDVTMTCGSRCVTWEKDVEVPPTVLYWLNMLWEWGCIHKWDWACVRVRGEHAGFVIRYRLHVRMHVRRTSCVLIVKQAEQTGHVRYS